MNALTELRNFLTESAARNRMARMFAALCDIEVAQDIVADVAREQEKVARDAYAAQQADLEAAKLIEAAASDGLTAEDLPAITTALRMIRRSAALDAKISEVAS